MEEIWKNIKGYEGLYQVSNMGRVRSFRKKRWIKNNGKLLKGRSSKSRGLKTGYYRVCLCDKENISKNFCIHKLVAEAFIPNPENKTQVDHINCDVADNRVQNLRWATQTENNNNPETIKKKGKYKINGISAVKLAETNGISWGGFYTRLRKAWSLKKAVFTPLMRRSKR